MSAPTKVTADTAKLPLMLTALRLPTFANLWPAFADRADREGWPAARFLAALAELELAERDRRRIQRHLREARLPMGKTLESFDFAAVPTLSKAHVMALAEGDSWLAKGNNILAFGPPGGGKSHLAAALGHALIHKGYRVLFTRTTDLVQRLQTARQNLTLAQDVAKLDKFHLLILDDLSYVQKDHAETSVLFELIAARYERRSIMIYVIWNMALRGLFRTCPAARFPQPRAVRWAKVGRVRPLQGADSRSGATWANNRAKCAGSDFRAWRDWLKGSSGLRSNRCSGWHTTRLRPTGEDWKISCAGVAVREWWRDVRAATTWRATSSTFASVVDLGASGSSHWTRGQACRTRRFSSASRRFDCSSTFSSNRGFATSTR